MRTSHGYRPGTGFAMNIVISLLFLPGFAVAGFPAVFGLPGTGSTITRATTAGLGLIAALSIYAFRHRYTRITDTYVLIDCCAAFGAFGVIIGIALAFGHGAKADFTTLAAMAMMIGGVMLNAVFVLADTLTAPRTTPANV